MRWRILLAVGAALFLSGSGCEVSRVSVEGRGPQGDATVTNPFVSLSNLGFGPETQAALEAGLDVRAGLSFVEDAPRKDIVVEVQPLLRVEKEGYPWWRILGFLNCGVVIPLVLENSLVHYQGVVLTFYSAEDMARYTRHRRAPALSPEPDGKQASPEPPKALFKYTAPLDFRVWKAEGFGYLMLPLGVQGTHDLSLAKQLPERFSSSLQPSFDIFSG